MVNFAFKRGPVRRNNINNIRSINLVKNTTQDDPSPLDGGNNCPTLEEKKPVEKKPVEKKLE